MTIFRHRIRKFIERLWTSPFPDVLARESFLRASIYIRRVNGDSIMRWKRFDPRKNTKRNEIQSSSRISTFRRFRSNLFLTYENTPLYYSPFVSSESVFIIDVAQIFPEIVASNATSIARNILSETFWPAARNFFPTFDHAFTFVRYIDIRPRLVPIFRGDVRLSSCSCINL